MIDQLTFEYLLDEMGVRSSKEKAAAYNDPNGVYRCRVELAQAINIFIDRGNLSANDISSLNEIKNNLENTRDSLDTAIEATRTIVHNNRK